MQLDATGVFLVESISACFWLPDETAEITLFMTATEFYREIDEIVENTLGTIKGNEELASLGGWDSLAILGVISLADSKFEVTVSAANITKCRTVADLAKLFAPHVQS